jgi:hypothetical protein
LETEVSNSSIIKVKGAKMSLRATERLIAEIVTVSGLANSPKMVVQAVNADTKMVTTIWFSDTHTAQQGVFPVGSLDKVEANTTAVRGKKSIRKRPGRKK